jgi:hypothetical protein
MKYARKISDICLDICLDWNISPSGTCPMDGFPQIFRSELQHKTDIISLEPDQHSFRQYDQILF